MQPKEFRYTLIVPQVDSYELINAPSGWEDKTEVSFKRNETYVGSVRTLTVPLQFTTEGALILRNQFYQYNTQALVYVQIDKLNRSTWAYELAFYGRLDFSKCTDEDDYFEIPALDADINAKIKAFDSVKYEFSLNDPNAIDLTLTPIDLKEKADFLFKPSELDQQPGFVALEIINNEIKSVNQSVKDVDYSTDLSPNFATSDQWFYNAQSTNTIELTFREVQGLLQSFLTGSNRFRLQLVKNNGAVVATLLDTTISGSFYPFEINTTVSIPLTVGEKLFLYERTDGILGSNTGWNWTGGTLSASYITQSPATKCRAFRPKYLFQQLIKKINGGFDYPIQSTLLDQWEQLTITSGDGIRQIPNAVVKTSFRDFFTSISALLCAGSGVENATVTLEQRSSYFRNVKTLSMLDSKDVKITPANDLLFNRIKVGYPNQTYDEINGKDEINSQQNYVIDSINTDKELDLMSIYRADAYGIEFLRINLEGKNTTDSDSDNDVFFVYADRQPLDDGSYPPFRDGVITGVSAGDSFYNWYISPKRNLMRWGAYIRSVYYKNDGYQIRFSSALKNAAVTSSTFGVSVTENANVFLAELEPPYFTPMYADFITKLPNDLWRYFGGGIYGYGEFIYKGVTMQGFFIESEIDLAMNSEREFKLLLTINNNLTQLIV